MTEQPNATYPYRPDLVTPTLVEQVLAVHALLIGREKYQALLRAETDEQAVEGALHFDDFLAAKMIQEKALELGREYPELAIAQLAPVCDVVEVHLRNGWEARRPQFMAKLAEEERESKAFRQDLRDFMDEMGDEMGPQKPPRRN